MKLMSHTSYDDHLGKIELERIDAGKNWRIIVDGVKLGRPARDFTEALEIADEIRAGLIEVDSLS